MLAFLPAGLFSVLTLPDGDDLLHGTSDNGVKRRVEQMKHVCEPDLRQDVNGGSFDHGASRFLPKESEPLGNE